MPAEKIAARAPGREPVEARRRFALTMYWLATGAMYHVVGHAFGVHKSTVHNHLHTTVMALKEAMQHEYIKFPEGQALTKVMQDFEGLCRLPQVAGALDGCFIPMVKPAGPWGFRYWCYKNFTAILLLACVDARGIFTFIDVGKPGSVGDASVFNDSTLKHRFCTNNFSAQHVRRIHGVAVPPLLVADSAFPLFPTIMKCFAPDPPYGGKNWYFNFCVIRTRRVVEQAFGRLKGRWWVCREGRLRDPVFMTAVTIVCCCLHNFCELRPELCAFDGDLFYAEEPEDRVRNLPPSTNATSIRDALAKHVWRQRRLGM